MEDKKVINNWITFNELLIQSHNFNEPIEDLIKSYHDIGFFVVGLDNLK